ncbi:MAG: glycogen debranching protein GlgX [Trebonia sp.]
MVTSTSAQYRIAAGHQHPLGAVADEDGVNFSVYAPRATAVTLLLFDAHDAPLPAAAIALDPTVNRTFHFWHVYVGGAAAGLHYAYRVDGQRDLAGSGDRYNPAKVLVDPYARGITQVLWNRARACDPDDNLDCSMRSVVIDAADYDWEGDRPLERPLHQTVICELHVGGFTRSPSSGTAKPGTFSGIVEKIPYLRDLGVTAVELLPVFSFDESGAGGTAQNGTPRRDYWGYNPVGFFSPHAGYCSAAEEGCHITEFRDMVKALHRAGIEVILDVVFNHTSEGNHQGPVISLKGLSNDSYYCLAPTDKQYYLDFTGCGNTVDCNHPVTEKMILECLEFWVGEMHVDGFRFDECSILSRGPDGTPLDYPPVLWGIELSERLADAKIIAEAWDAGGLYQVANFPGGPRWSVWNGRYRDDVRRFVRGDGGLVGQVATRIAGSSDLFQPFGQVPANSVNFITAHDGFTLNDLVSYNAKHNEANGEGNRDGNDDNISWNCGAEGPASDPSVEALRERQIKNFATILLISQGVPMFVAGDEIRRTQQGNNNAYCQDNEISWFDWDLARENQAMFRFFKEMIAFRGRHQNLRRLGYFSGQKNERGLPDIAWHGCRLGSSGWSDPDCSVLAFTLGGFDGDNDLHVLLNMSGQDLDFDVPPAPGLRWWRAVDTSLPPPECIARPGDEIQVKPADHYRVNSHSAVILLSR